MDDIRDTYSENEEYESSDFASTRHIFSSSSSSSSSEPEICKMYELKSLAQHIVKETFKEALKDVKTKTQDKIRLEHKEIVIPNIQWPSNQDFTVKRGEDKIAEFIQTWERDPKWLFCIDFLYQENDDFSFYFHYEVKWSIPTPPYPIPQATVSVFFVMEVSKVQMDNCPVNVWYQFETDPYMHRPGETMFREQWLSDILERKISFFKSLRF